MSLRRLSGVIGFVASSLPLAASAAVVAVAPLEAASPAMGWVAFGVLVVAMSVAGAFVLRRNSSKVSLGLAVFALAVGLGTASYASNTIFIMGDECFERTEKMYDEEQSSHTLESNCDNPIKIVELDLDCNEKETAPHTGSQLCTLGLVLQRDDSCSLPNCD